MKRGRKIILAILFLDLLIAAGIVWYFRFRPAPAPAHLPAPSEAPLPSPSAKPDLRFDGKRAYQDVMAQADLGPRTPDSEAHAQVIHYIQGQLAAAGWESSVQQSEFNGKIVKNILATRNIKSPTLILGAHYDSRLYADNDPDTENHTQPVPGANDGASGVAVLLELARTLPQDSAPVWLVFFDAEDNGRIPGWDWILGSRAYAEALTETPQAVVVVDMIGDADLNIYMEKNSDPEYTRQIWETAKSLGYESAFIPEYKFKVLDDHLPFVEKGLRAVDLIDLDYPYWHTLGDTADKVSAQSLQMVGDTLTKWIEEFK